MINGNLEEMIKKAGFQLWEDESWKPEGAIVDWGCNYDHELETLCRLIVEKCIDICKDGAPTQMSCEGVAQRIGNFFNVDTRNSYNTFAE